MTWHDGRVTNIVKIFSWNQIVISQIKFMLNSTLNQISWSKYEFLQVLSPVLIAKTNPMHSLIVNFQTVTWAVESPKFNQARIRACTWCWMPTLICSQPVLWILIMKGLLGWSIPKELFLSQCLKDLLFDQVRVILISKSRRQGLARSNIH